MTDHHGAKILLVWGMLILSISPLSRCSDPGRQESTREPRKPRDEYTRETPGEWEELAGEHLPVVTITPGDNQNILVRVNLKSPGKGHYIEKIGIMDGKKRDLVVKVFSRHARHFEVRFTLFPLPDDEDIKVYAKCNLHDLWTVPLKDAIRNQ